MVICNVVCRETADIEGLNRLKNMPIVNVIDNITNIRSEVPTLFYGLALAQEHLGEVDRKSTKISNHYYWTYSDKEYKAENWLEAFVKKSGEDWFKFKDRGIDVVFDKFDMADFVGDLQPWPMIHEGTYEIYIADWRLNIDTTTSILIYSIKKDTLEYLDIDPKDFLQELYDALEYRFLAIEAKRFDLSNENKPIFLDDLLYANTDKWVGIDEIINHFVGTGVEIDRRKVIVYYLKQSAFLRRYFSKY